VRLPLLVALLLPLASAAAADPHVDYMLQCQGCHLHDGGGTPGAVPPLAGSVGRFLAVPGGREFLVRVPGSSQSPLDDARLAAVLNWLLVRFDPQALPADFAPFSAEEVARIRRPPLTDVEGERRRLLSRIGEPAP
jgi:mono/diheme cytochrome c family protein